MDEPTASLTNEEVNHLFSVVRQLKEEGKGIVFITHKMNEIIELGDRVTVLKDGAYVGTRNVSDVTIDDLVAMMVGRTVKHNYQHEEDHDFEKEDVIFEVRNLTRKDDSVKIYLLSFIREKYLDFQDL